MLEIITALIGAFLGGIIEDEEGALLGGLIGFALGWVWSTRRRLGTMSAEIAALNERLDAVARDMPPVELDLDLPEMPAAPARRATTAPPASTAAGGEAPDATAGLRAQAQPAAASTQPSARVAPDFGHVPPPQPASSAPPAGSATAPAPAASEDGWGKLPDDVSSPIANGLAKVMDFIRGANTMVLVGVVVLFFGVAFLAKLAIDANLVPIELRLAGIAAFGIGLTMLGWRFRSDRRSFALPLQGGGVGVLFLTVFAAYRLYGVIPAEMCFALLVALVAFGAVLAVVQNAPAMAALAISGGFLAPLLASTGSGDHVTLFSYYLVLNLGVLGIAWFKAWRILNLLGFAFTFIIGTIWGAKYYKPELFDSTEPFLIAHFLLYTIVSVLFALRQPPRLRGLVDSTLVFGTPLVVFALQSQLVRGMEMGMAWSAIGGAAYYIGLAALLSRIGSMRLLLEAFIANGVVLATIAVPLALDARWTSVTWALEGAGALWIGVRQQRWLPRIAGAALQFFAGAAWLVHTDRHPIGDATVFANAQYLGAVLVALSGLFCGVYLYKARDRLMSLELVLAAILAVWGMCWWYGAGISDILLHGDTRYTWGSLLLFLSVSGAAFACLQPRVDWMVWRIPAIAQVLLFAAVALGMAVFEKHPFVDLAWLGWPAALLAQALALRSIDDGPDWLRAVLHGASVWLTTGILAWAAGYWLDRWFGGRYLWEPVCAGLLPAIAVMLGVRAAGGTRWPAGVHAADYLRVVCTPMVAALFAWAWLINLSPPGRDWPLAYLPLVNPIDIANGFALVAAVMWFRQSRRVLGDWLQPTVVNTALSVLAATVFMWANAILFRSIHFWAGVRYDINALWSSDITQSSIAIFWSVLGVTGMWAGARKGLRAVWFTAAALMGVVVLKLFFVDLANTDTLERVVSFVSVGLLMVLVGYFAPAPPRAAQPRAVPGEGTT